MIIVYKINIISIAYLFEEEYDRDCFDHIDARVMDELSKRALLLARKMFGDTAGTKGISGKSTGIVIAANTAPCGALREHADVLRVSGYRGINPSKFPNTMLSTVLCRVAKEFCLKGSSTVLYCNVDKSEALRYAVVQIRKGRSDQMAVLYIGEGQNSFGIMLQDQNLEAKEKPRFYIDCFNQRIMI